MSSVTAPSRSHLGEPTRLPTYEERWDIFNEVLDFVEFAKDLGIPEMDAIAADAKKLERNDDAPPMHDLVKLSRRIWALPDAVRAKILNGWKLDPPHQRLNREQLECREAHEAIRKGLLIETFPEAVGGLQVESSLAMWHTETRSPVRLQLAVGTSKEQALALVDAIRAKIESDWHEMVGSYSSQREEYAEIADPD